MYYGNGCLLKKKRLSFFLVTVYCYPNISVTDFFLYKPYFILKYFLCIIYNRLLLSFSEGKNAFKPLILLSFSVSNLGHIPVPDTRRNSSHKDQSSHHTYFPLL